jgi:hypothetical protein
MDHIGQRCPALPRAGPGGRARVERRRTVTRRGVAGVPHTAVMVMMLFVLGLAAAVAAVVAAAVWISRRTTDTGPAHRHRRSGARHVWFGGGGGHGDGGHGDGGHGDGGGWFGGDSGGGWSGGDGGGGGGGGGD